MRRRMLVELLGAACLTAGCVGGDEPRPADATAMRRQMIQRAEGNVAGTVVSIDEGTLELEPFPSKGERVRYTLGDDVGIFIGGEPSDRTALRPGVPINVFFIRDGAEARAVCVQLLEPGIARALQQGY